MLLFSLPIFTSRSTAKACIAPVSVFFAPGRPKVTRFLGPFLLIVFHGGFLASYSVFFVGIYAYTKEESEDGT